MQYSNEQPRAYLRPPLWAGHFELGRLVLTVSFVRAREREGESKLLHNRLALLRQERGLAREELARYLHIHPSTLRALERGSYVPSLSLALQLSEFFALPVEAIFLPSGPELA